MPLCEGTQRREILRILLQPLLLERKGLRKLKERFMIKITRSLIGFSVIWIHY
jgi:hypothetical protein